MREIQAVSFSPTKKQSSKKYLLAAIKLPFPSYTEKTKSMANVILANASTMETGGLEFQRFRVLLQLEKSFTFPMPMAYEQLQLPGYNYLQMGPKWS